MRKMFLPSLWYMHRWFWKIPVDAVLQKETPAIYFEQKLTSQIASLESSILSSMKMSAEFQNIADIDEAMDLLENYVHSIPNCSEFYLCLYANWDSVSQHILELTENEMDFEPSQDEII